jgi:hemin uptake protein HemP
MNPQPPSSEPAPLAENTQPRQRIDSEKILGGATTVEIDHAGQRYLLRVTRENKLILTK